MDGSNTKVDNVFAWQFGERGVKRAVALLAFIDSSDRTVMDYCAGVEYLEKLLPDSIAWNEGFGCEFIIINDESEVKLLQKSKYLQPEVGMIYKEVKKHLNKDIEVLFCGLPCPVSALYSSLQDQECKNLFTIDLLCHMTPSKRHFKEYNEERDRFFELAKRMPFGKAYEYSLRSARG